MVRELTNGNPDGVAYKTGLFDFNTSHAYTPSWIVNLGLRPHITYGGRRDIRTITVRNQSPQ